MNSSFECSDNVGIDLVTRNMVLMMSCDEYPRSLNHDVSFPRISNNLTESLTRAP